MSKISDFISDLSLDEGRTYRGDCPICQGRNTFTVTNDIGNIMYNCYKNSCGISGAHRTDIDAFAIQEMLYPKSRKSASESYEEALHGTFELPPYIDGIPKDNSTAKKFLIKWNLNPDDVLYDIRQERIVFPVHTKESVLVDAVGRSLANRTPKWLRYNNSPVPYSHGSGKTAVIVEDVISAYTVGEHFKGVTGVALLGTQLTDFHKKYIKNNYSDAIVALDPDATDKGVDMANELRCYVIGLYDDLKYAREEDFDQLTKMLKEMSRDK